MSDKDRVILTKDEAIALLPDKDQIHTFRSATGVLLGADWDRSELLKAIATYEVELSGPMAASLKHGMALTDNHGPLFIETNEGLP